MVYGEVEEEKGRRQKKKREAMKGRKEFIPKFSEFFFP